MNFYIFSHISSWVMFPVIFLILLVIVFIMHSMRLLLVWVLQRVTLSTYATWELATCTQNRKRMFRVGKFQQESLVYLYFTVIIYQNCRFLSGHISTMTISRNKRTPWKCNLRLRQSKNVKYVVCMMQNPAALNEINVIFRLIKLISSRDRHPFALLLAPARINSRKVPSRSWTAIEIFALTAALSFM